MLRLRKGKTNVAQREVGEAPEEIEMYRRKRKMSGPPPGDREQGTRQEASSEVEELGHGRNDLGISGRQISIAIEEGNLNR